MQHEYKIDFHVVGTSYQGAAAEMVVENLEEGQLLDLRPEPDNPRDSLAVAVYADDVRVGYVPNQGFSCAACFRPVRYNDSQCTHCGSLDFAPLGLAGRLVRGKRLENKDTWTAYVSGLDTEAKDGRIRCSLVFGLGSPSV